MGVPAVRMWSVLLAIETSSQMLSHEPAFPGEQQTHGSRHAGVGVWGPSACGGCVSVGLCMWVGPGEFLK